MSGYLLRDDAPLSEAIWKQIDEMVATVVTKNLVGRRIVPLVGPLGWGVEVVPLSGFAGADEGYVAGTVAYLELEQLEAEFRLRLKHLAMADQTPYGLDLGAAATAAAVLARKEDEKIIGGLVAKAAKGVLGDWGSPNGPFSAVADAIAALRGGGFDGPFALVLNHKLYARLASLMMHGQRELRLVEQLVEAGIFQTPVLGDDQALVLSPQSWNMDMVVGQDIATAFVGNEGLDLGFCILETVALRVKRPGAALLLS